MSSSLSRLAAATRVLRSKPVAIFLNAARLDYDCKLDFSRLASLTDFRRNNVDYVKDSALLLEKVQGAEIVITKEMEVPLDVLKEFPSCVKLLCEAGTGFNNIPVTQARSQNIAVCNVPTYSTDAVAHMAITHLMNLSISMTRQQKMLWSNDRSNFTGPFALPLQEINGKTLGLIGGGGLIGSRVADVALQLGMNIIISSRAGKLPDTHRHSSNPNVRVVKSTDMDTLLLAESDYVSIHCPLNDETRGTFGRAQITKMKPTAFLINTSRGAICNEPELVDCLKEGVICGAGLDVTVGEPPDMDSELWTLPNVTLTPHIGWRRIETRQRLVDMTADNVHAYVNRTSESDMINVIN
jgi:glycerate dehydrogenase